tara:strand:+ start:788 stop:1636 length:849 start_codon:yes stop_codon:yes gene_type:complete
LKKIIVDIYGGIGNQIFQYSFAHNLRSQGYLVSVNTKINKKDNNQMITNRKRLLDPELFEFNNSNIIYISMFEALNIIDPKKKLLYRLRKYLSWQNENNFDIKKLVKLNRLTGHWQNIDAFLENKNFIKQSIQKLGNFKDKDEINFNDDGLTAIHIRRGDYVDLDLTLSLNYYKNAINMAKKSIKNFKFEVFSDDIEWAKSAKIFNKCIKFNEYSNSEQSNLEDFKKLFKFKNYIISNSTFSLIPALLNSDKNGKVFYPDPWIKDKKLINKPKDNWIMIKDE